MAGVAGDLRALDPAPRPATSRAGGENFYDVQQRFVPFIHGLIERYRSTDANLSCAAHGGLYWMMLPQVLQNVDYEFIRAQGGFTYASFITAEWRAEKMICTAWNGLPVPA